MNLIWVSSDLSYAWFHILVILFELWVLFGQLDLWFLQWEKCLVLGSYRAVTSHSDRRGSEARIMLLPSRVKRWGFHHWFEIIPLHHVILLKALLCSFGLNTLDACWIAVDVWSNSSRCRKYRSTCFGRDAYRYNHCIDIVTTLHSSINCSTVICSPTVYLLSWEKPLVNTTAPGSIHIHRLHLGFYFALLLCCFQFSLGKQSIRDWQPLHSVGCKLFVFVQVLVTWHAPPTGSIPWFSKLREILTLLYCIILSSSGKSNAVLKR